MYIQARLSSGGRVYLLEEWDVHVGKRFVACACLKVHMLCWCIIKSHARASYNELRVRAVSVECSSGARTSPHPHVVVISSEHTPAASSNSSMFCLARSSVIHAVSNISRCATKLACCWSCRRVRVQIKIQFSPHSPEHVIFYSVCVYNVRHAVLRCVHT